jgi:hypothetical protein
MDDGFGRSSRSRLDRVVREARARDDERLAGLEAVDAGVDVDGVRAEDREQRHVDQVPRNIYQ